MIRQLKKSDKKQFVAMVTEFYDTDAVIGKIALENIYQTFDEICKGGPYIKAYVVEIENILVGYSVIAFTYSSEVGGLELWIEEIYIRPGFQGRGIGKSLMAHIEGKYKKEVARIRLEIEPSNERAKKLYEELGFDDLAYKQMFKI